MPTVGFLTIGQSPRPDIVPEILEALGSSYRGIEAGALDGLGLDEIAALNPAGATDIVVSRLRDGTLVNLSKAALAPRIQGLVDDLDSVVDVHVLLCTGAYPIFVAQKPVLDVERTLRQHAAMHKPDSIGIFIPIEEQRASTVQTWKALAGQVNVATVTPYEGTLPIKGAAERFSENPVDLIVMSCLAYDAQMRRIVEDLTKSTVLLPRHVLADEIKHRLQ